MNNELDEPEDDSVFADRDDSDVSSGKAADSYSLIERAFPEDLRSKFELYSYRNAASVLETSFPAQFASLLKGLSAFEISKEMIRTPGGSKGPIARYVDTLFVEADGWKEARISADLHVKLLHAKKKDSVIDQYVREGFLDGHRIDFLNGRGSRPSRWCNFGCGRGPSSGGFGGDV